MIIRRSQIDALEAAMARAFVASLVEHLQTFAPELSRILGQERITKVVESGIERAQTYGLTNRGPVRFFIELIFTLGNEFDSDPQLPWAAHILRAPGIPDQMLRADRLYRETTAFMGEVGGLHNEHAIAALKALAEQLRTSKLRIPPGDSSSGILNGFRATYPQKYEFVGKAALEVLVDEARQAALSYSWSSEQQVALCAGLMYAFGHGIFRDPVYPWAGATLEDPSIPSPDDRSARLMNRTRAYVEGMLKNLG